MKFQYLILLLFTYSCNSKGERNIINFLGFSLPKNTVELNSSKSSMTGEGFTHKVYLFKESEFNKITEKLDKENYKIISNENLVKDGFLSSNGEPQIFIPDTDLKKLVGFYKIKNYNISELEFEAAFFNNKTKKLIYYKSY